MFGFACQFSHGVCVYRHLVEASCYRRFTLREDAFSPLFRVVKMLSMFVACRFSSIQSLADRFCIHLSHQTPEILLLTPQRAALMHVLRVANRVQEDFRQIQGLEFGRFEIDQGLTKHLQLQAVPFSLRLAYEVAFGNFFSVTHDT